MAALLGSSLRRPPGLGVSRAGSSPPPDTVRRVSTRERDARHGQDGLVEPLTGRERDVLRLLATDLDGPAIARELVVSLNTVRTHTKNLYAKLGVTNRRAAVTRAHAAQPARPRRHRLTAGAGQLRLPRRTSPPISPHDVIRSPHIGS